MPVIKPNLQFDGSDGGLSNVAENLQKALLDKILSRLSNLVFSHPSRLYPSFKKTLYKNDIDVVKVRNEVSMSIFWWTLFLVSQQKQWEWEYTESDGEVKLS